MQDDWKARRNLVVNVGLRWEYNAPVTDQRDRFLTLRPGRQSAIFPDAPVVLGNGKLAIRSAYGLLYDSPNYQFGAPFIAAPPFNITTLATATRYADPWGSSLIGPARQPFPFHPRTPGERFDFTALAPLNLGFYDPGFAAPYTQQWSLQVQQQIRRTWLVEIGYVGSRGVKLLSQHQVNPAVVTPTATATDENSRRRLNIGNPQDALYGGAVFGSIVSEATDANSNYHSLQIGVTRKYSNGFQFSHAYTLGHAIDNTSSIDWSGSGNTTRTDSLRADRGSSAFDVRQRYVFTYLYELPYFKDGHGFTNRVLGGWGVSGITTIQTGLALDIVDSNNRCLCGSGGQRPDYVGGQVQFLDPRSRSEHFWFDGAIGTPGTGAPNPYFRRVGAGPTAAQGAGRFGNLGRNVFHGPGINNWDVAAFKKLRAGENGHIDFRAELLNVFNHAQFLNPNGNIQQNAMFGRITATRDPRIAQLTLRYVF